MKIIENKIRSYCENVIERNVNAIPAGDYDYRNEQGAGAHVVRYGGRLIYAETFVGDDKWRSSVNVSPCMKNAEWSEVLTAADGAEVPLIEDGGNFGELSLRSLMRVTRATMHARKIAPTTN